MDGGDSSSSESDFDVVMAQGLFDDWIVKLFLVVLLHCLQRIPYKKRQEMGVLDAALESISFMGLNS